MMSSPVIDAFVCPQRQALRTIDSYTLERIERSLDEILRNPQSETPSPQRVRSALGHALEALQRRKEIAPRDCGDSEPGYTEPAFQTTEVIAWIEVEPGFSASDRALLTDLVGGWDAETIAARDGIPVARVRERISRCRRRARALCDSIRLAA